jgi:hypothetical protein
MNAEKENTFRSLREEELLMTSLQCRFGWHKWTKYREPEKSREGLYDLILQQRRCVSCNKADRRVISRV